MFDKDPLTAMEAVTAAQTLAFAPLAFQSILAMRDRGVLSALMNDEAGKGKTKEEISEESSLSDYATRILLEAGLGLKILWRKDGRYHLGKLGYFILTNEMTRINFDFTRDICYGAAAHLDEALVTGKPAGLKELGVWATLYEGLSILPEPALSSWHRFDHFYSDAAFPAILEKLAEIKPRKLLDVGCNTGKWAHSCLTRFPEMEIGLLDLQPQLERARKTLATLPAVSSTKFYPMDVRDPGTPLPTGYDIIWMSQFLDCFSDEEIINILKKFKSALAPGASLWILELFWDRQRFEAAALSLQQTSLYFACVANGNSQMYDSQVFLGLIEKSGLEVTRISDGIGGYHTLVECSPLDSKNGLIKPSRGMIEPQNQPELQNTDELPKCWSTPGLPNYVLHNTLYPDRSTGLVQSFP